MEFNVEPLELDSENRKVLILFDDASLSSKKCIATDQLLGIFKIESLNLERMEAFLDWIGQIKRTNESFCLALQDYVQSKERRGHFPEPEKRVKELAEYLARLTYLSEEEPICLLFQENFSHKLEEYLIPYSDTIECFECLNLFISQPGWLEQQVKELWIAWTSFVGIADSVSIVLRWLAKIEPAKDAEITQQKKEKIVDKTAISDSREVIRAYLLQHHRYRGELNQTPVTLEQVAAECKCSRSTVSRFIKARWKSHKAYCRICENYKSLETAMQILDGSMSDTKLRGLMTQHLACTENKEV